MRGVLIIETNKENKKFMPTNDFFFKKIFGSVGSEKITKSLLEAILKIDITAIDLDKNPITEKEVLDDKLGVMDIRLEINGNVDCDVEMEMINRGNIEIRLMRYVSKIFIKGLKVGEKYVEAKDSIAILIANFELAKHKEVKKILTEYEMREKDYGNIVLTDKIKVYILELPKIERMKSEDKNLNLWIKFIKDLEVKHMADNEEKDEKLEETIKAIQEAKKKYEELCQDEHARYIAELREKYVEETASVRQMGYEEGLEKGLETGQEKGKKEIAKMMKDNNYSIEEIMKMTKLSKEDIEKL